MIPIETNQKPRTWCKAPQEEEKIEPVSFLELFGNSRPVEVEIGCGKGKFLMARALEMPGINFFGLDKAGKWMSKRKKQAEKKELPNLIFMKTGAWEWVRRIPAGKVSLFHIYFPDPWPKRRHYSRRLITRLFLETLHACLCPGGKIEIATDHEDYWQWILKAKNETAPLWSSMRESASERIFAPHLKTNYELKFEAQGKPLHYLELQKADQP